MTSGPGCQLKRKLSGAKSSDVADRVLSNEELYYDHLCHWIALGLVVASEE